MDDALHKISASTVAHYDSHAEDFWEGTRNHDVSQNYAAFLEGLAARPENRTEGRRLRLLDLGCGPGRDLLHFSSLGHDVTGLDGCAAFVDHAKRVSGCDVWRQDFLELRLPPNHFDGIFANASLFHVPSRELPRVLGELRASLVPEGILFCSNPRGADREGWSGDRYGCYFERPTWLRLFEAAGFDEVLHYHRPTDAPPEEQRWLAMVLRRAR